MEGNRSSVGRFSPDARPFFFLRLGVKRSEKRRGGDCQFDAKRGKNGGGVWRVASKRGERRKKTRKTSLFFFFLEFFRRKGAYFSKESVFWRRNCSKIRNGVDTTSTAPKRRAAFDESRYYLTRRGKRPLGKVGKTNAKKRLVGRLRRNEKKITKRAAFENAFSTFKTLKTTQNRKCRAIRPKTDLNIKGEFRSGKENVVR